jgi:hypothetical protein
MKLDYEYIPSQEEVRRHIQNCEGHHTQQAVYSTFHDALTQVCYGCLKVRSTINRLPVTTPFERAESHWNRK